jgi:(1->4)-alpha-D-glucan 1-alpha-D-glucosylmutase
MRADRHWDVEPDRVLEHVMWQTLVGAWPLPLERARRYAEKAAREARLRTSWRAPDATYEAALSRWVDGVYSDTELVADIAKLAAELAPHGERNALAQLVVKLCAPGVADFYQGCELHDDNLVDPDNRRAVDFAARNERLRWLADASPRAVLDTGDVGYAKLWTIRRVLAVRRKRPALWDGAYRPIVAIGPHAERAFAFARGDALVAIVPRLTAKLRGDWGGTRLPLPAGAWRDVLADRDVVGGSRDVADLLATFPVAVLVRG